MTSIRSTSSTGTPRASARASTISNSAPRKSPAPGPVHRSRPPPARQGRCVERFLYELEPRFDAALTVLIQNKTRVGENSRATPAVTGDSSTSFGVGVRPEYHVTKAFKIQTDFG